MDRIYENASDVHVRATYVYKSSTPGDTYAYSNEDCTETIDKKTLYEMFLKGIVIVSGSSIYIPSFCSTTPGTTIITYVKPNTTTSTSADLATLVSKEPVV